MTLILALANRDYSVQVSDRRLTSLGAVVDEETCKGGALETGDARLAFGFTGIARVLGFEIRRWIMSTLLECGPPDHIAQFVLERFRSRASQDFVNLPQLGRLRPEDKRITIIFSGFLYSESPPRVVYAMLSNFQDFNTGEDSPSAWPEFRSFYARERRPWTGEITSVQRIGQHMVAPGEVLEPLRALLERRLPMKAVVGKAIRLLVRLADTSGARGTIGKQITWISIPSDPSKAVETGYYATLPSRAIWIAGMVTTVTGFVWDDAMVRLEDQEDQEPIVVPRVRKNAPCPCASGAKYRACHGSRTRSEMWWMPHLDPQNRTLSRRG